MFEVCKLYFNKSKSYRVFHICLCCGILFSSFFILSKLWNIKDGEESPFSKYPTRANYVSYAFEKNGLKNLDYNKLEEQLEQENLNDRVGYVKVDEGNRVLGKAVTTIYLNEYMRQFQYELEEGEWFEAGNNDSIVIGGELCDVYKIGDCINLTRIDGVEHKACVIGKLPNPYEILLLNCSGEELDYNSIGSSNLGNVIITVSSAMVGEGSIISEEALVVDDMFLDTLEQDVLESLKVTRIDSIGKVSDSTIKRFNMYLLIAVSLFCILYSVYLECKEDPDKLQIYYLMGIDFYKLCLIVVAPQFVFWTSSLCIVAFFHLIRMDYGEQKMVFECIALMFGFLFVLFLAAYVAVYKYIRHSWCKIERDIV